MPSVTAAPVIDLIRQADQTIQTIINLDRDVKDAAGLPRVFPEVAQRLPLVQHALNIVERQITRSNPDETYLRGIEPGLRNCKDKTERLENIFQVVLPLTDSATRYQLYRDAVHSFGRGDRLETLMKGILEDLTVMIRNHAAKAASPALLQGLDQAIQELSEMSPSLPEDASRGVNIINTGPGTQVILLHQGTGLQHNNQGQQNHGPGNMFFASTLNIGSIPPSGS